MTLLSKNVVTMKPKIGIASDDQQRSSEPVFLKQNLKMAINRNMTMKKNSDVGSLDNYARGTVLVNNVITAVHRSPAVANVRTIVSSAKNQVGIPNNELLRCKRKIHFISGQSYPGTQPASVARRNARERNRVKQVNNGFATLRSHIPASVAAALSSEKSSPRNSSASKKLSKVETLKMAVEYIRSLQQMLEDHNSTLEKKVASLDQQMTYDKHFEIDDNYYSSSPETVHSGTVGDSSQSYPGDSPCRIFPKIEPTDADCYSHQEQYAKSEPEDAYIKSDVYQIKSENFNHKLHETLTSEFYGARSPVKTYYLNQNESQDVVNCDYKIEEKAPYEQTVISDKLDYSIHGDMPEGDKRNSSPNLTVLTSVPVNQVIQYNEQSFVQAHGQGNPASLSPTVSEACPSPTPSYSSDHSSVHMGSVVSGSSGHLISSMSRLTTHSVHPDSYKSQLTSPIPRSVSPIVPKCLTPPRTLSPLSVGGSKYMVPDPSSPSNQSSYSVSMEFQKGSPDGYDNYESVSPEDEELLDVISWWQQSH